MQTGNEWGVAGVYPTQRQRRLELTGQGLNLAGPWSLDFKYSGSHWSVLSWAAR